MALSSFLRACFIVAGWLNGLSRVVRMTQASATVAVAGCSRGRAVGIEPGRPGETPQQRRGGQPCGSLVCVFPALAGLGP